MKTRLIIDGNAFYEVDEECMERKEKEEGQRKREAEKSEKNPDTMDNYQTRR